MRGRRGHGDHLGMDRCRVHGFADCDVVQVIIPQNVTDCAVSVSAREQYGGNRRLAAEALRDPTELAAISTGKSVLVSRAARIARSRSVRNVRPVCAFSCEFPGRQMQWRTLWKQ